MKKRLIAFAALIVLCTCCTNKTVPPYKNPDLSIDERVEDLLGRMTLEEKFW